jgi:hypothetical protein
MTVDPKRYKDLASEPVRVEYRQRALTDLALEVGVVDFGQHAGATTGACFWLCLAAGLASLDWSPDCVNGQALPAVLATLLAETRAMDLRALDRAEPGLIKDTPLGKLAATLRHHFCAGPSPVLLRLGMMDRIFQAFAGLQEDGPTRTLQMYKRWVEKLATREFADELVVVAVAMELKIAIVCVPHTPQEAASQWVVSTYQDSDSAIPHDRMIYLGNNDVHYMWLSRPTV